jgi:hypothetical protein
MPIRPGRALEPPRAIAAARLRTDTAATVQRLEALRSYMDEHVLGPGGFCCASFAACRASTRDDDRFFEGQLSHVGGHYDLHLDDRPLRIVVVGQEYGAPRPGIDPSRISLAERYRQVHDRSGLESRYSADGTHPHRNPHMRGTTSALRIIFGGHPGVAWDEEFLEVADGERFHLFDAFSLVNVLLCSNFPATRNTGASTKVMRRNCLRHFAMTMEILEPTLMVLQGEGVQNWIGPVIGMTQERTPQLGEASIAGNRVLVCRFSHPSARGALSWGNRLDASYLRDVVEPTLRRAVSML